MKNKILLLICAVFVLSSCQRGPENIPVIESIPSNGHEQGNGTDNPPDGFGGAWVLGGETMINYCAVVSPDFGVDQQTAVKEIEAAFTTWKTYINVKKINETLKKKYIEQAKMSSENPDLDLISARAKRFQLATKTRFLTDCDGSENIKFYFGFEDAEVSKLKAGYFNPTAFSHRIQYDATSGQGRGIIWLVKHGGLSPSQGRYPDWSMTNRLRGVLLHELGHFFGIGHNEKTIMQENLFALLLDSEWTTEKQKYIEYKMSHVDHEDELYYPKIDDNDQVYKGTMMFFGSMSAAEESRANFEFMTGVNPGGNVTAQLVKSKLTLFDGLVQYDFDINFDNQKGHTAGVPVFKADRRWPKDPQDAVVGGSVSLASFSSSTVGEIETKPGIKVPVLLEQNMSHTPIMLYYLKDGRKKVLLTTDYLSTGL